MKYMDTRKRVSCGLPETALFLPWMSGYRIYWRPPQMRLFQKSRDRTSLYTVKSYRDSQKRKFWALFFWLVFWYNKKWSNRINCPPDSTAGLRYRLELCAGFWLPLPESVFLWQHRCRQDFSFPLYRQCTSGEFSLCFVFFCVWSVWQHGSDSFFQKIRNRPRRKFYPGLWSTDHWWSGYGADQQLCVLAVIFVHQRAYCPA